MSVLHHCLNLRRVLNPEFRLLIHSNDIDGAVNFTDSSGDNRSLSAYDVEHDTSQAKWLASSILFPSTGSINPDGSSGIFAASTDDYTFDLWYKGSSSPYGTFFMKNSNYYFSIASASSKPFIKFGATYYYSPTSLLQGVWYHIAIVRKAGLLYLFVDGILKVITTTSDNNEISLFTVGNIGTSIRGWVDEIAFRNIAAWDCSGAVVGDQVFTPPTAPYEV